MTKYILNKNEFIHSDLGGETIWMGMISSNFIELNETATFITDLLGKEALTENGVVEAICTEYDIAAADCASDVKEVLQTLTKTGLVQTC
jgi:Coenzyme PQQ synthesis protein D (PqqD)